MDNTERGNLTGADGGLHEENLHPLQWRSERIVVIGVDNRSRVVNVKTSAGIVKRPIRKLALISHGQ